MLLEDELQAFSSLQLVLECEDIRLRQLGTKKPRIVRGPGKIYQKADGHLHFEVYVRKGSLHDPGVSIVGEVLPRSTYYSLRATDWRGRRWTASHVYPRVRRWMPGRFNVVTGDLLLLKGVESETRSHDISHSVTGYGSRSG